MPLTFSSDGASVIDDADDLTIRTPRIQLDRTPSEVEYQYTLLRGTQRDGVCLLGTM